MTRVDLGGTKGHPIKTRGIVIGGRQVFGRANGFAPIDLSSWYKGTLPTWLPRMVLQLT